jgi:signal transduction histidine kinase
VAALLETENARSEAEAAVSAKDRFLAALSHELRTPLTPVLFAAEMLSGCTNLAANMQEAVSTIRRGVELETRFIDDLLDLTKVSRGTFCLELTTVDLHEVVRHAVKVCESDIVSREQLLEVALDVGEYRLTGDFTRLQQVFWNLLQNASKYTPERGAIRICSRREGVTWIIVEISDNGAGIEENALGRIFKPFEQGESAIRGKLGGIGLGLAICKGIVVAHRAPAEAGAGCNFYRETAFVISGSGTEPLTH